MRFQLEQQVLESIKKFLASDLDAVKEEAADVLDLVDK